MSLAYTVAYEPCQWRTRALSVTDNSGSNYPIPWMERLAQSNPLAPSADYPSSKGLSWQNLEPYAISGDHNH